MEETKMEMQLRYRDEEREIEMDGKRKKERVIGTVCLSCALLIHLVENP